jgi:hypothetical protein
MLVFKVPQSFKIYSQEVTPHPVAIAAVKFNEGSCHKQAGRINLPNLLFQVG